MKKWNVPMNMWIDELVHRWHVVFLIITVYCFVVKLSVWDLWLPSSCVNFCTSVGVDRTVPTSGSIFDPSLPSKRFLPIGAQSVDYFDMPQSNLAGERTERLSISGGVANTSKASWKPMNHHPKLWSDLPTRPTSHSLVGSKTAINGAQHESSLFSSSLSEIFTRKCKVLFSSLCLISLSWYVAYG